MRSLPALLAGTLALTVACTEPMRAPTSMGGPAAPSPTTGATTPLPSASASAEVPPQLRFTEPRLGGGTVRGADFAGRDLVMWFWAPW